MTDEAALSLGILVADAPAADLAARHGDYPGMFRRLLGDPAVQPPGCPVPTFHDFDARTSRLPAPDACDAYLVTGSRHSVYEPLPWIEPLAGFVGRALEAGRPVVGICFGHQLLAHHFGGETRAAASGWCVGVQEARVVAQTAWMTPACETFELLVSHQDQVVRLPPGARAFAESEHCPVAGFVMGRALAIQGHPEFTPGYAGALMERRREALGERAFRAGMASLRRATDAATVAAWILRFVHAARGERAEADPPGSQMSAS